MADAPASQPQDLEDLIAQIDEQASGSDQLSVDDLLDAVGHRAFGPLIAIPALLASSPLGAIPGLPTTLATLIILIAGQHLLGQKHPWIPRRLRQLSINADHWSSARDRIQPWAAAVDNVIRPRLTFLANGPAEYALSLLVIALAACMIPLELVPFAAALPGVTLLLLGLAIAADDGLLVLFAATGAIASLWVVYTTLT